MILLASSAYIHFQPIKDFDNEVTKNFCIDCKLYLKSSQIAGLLYGEDALIIL